MVRISSKLKRLKGVLQTWNKECFGRVEVELRRLEGRIVELESVLASQFSVQVENALLKCKQEHLRWVHRVETMACQKSRVKWLAEGDANTSFLHASMRLKKINKWIERMRLEDGRVLVSAEEVHEGAIDFFQQFLSVSNVERESADLDLIMPVVSNEENEALCAVPTLEEVRNALWSIPSDGSPGSDGFSASFFMMTWEIVKDDLVEMAQDFFSGQPVSTFFGVTNLVLIPKVDKPLGIFAQLVYVW